jgi:hypothetical protein
MEPGTSTQSLGTLPAGTVTFVSAGPITADGYDWYEVVQAGPPPSLACTEPTFVCGAWIGWVAGVTPDGERWLETTVPDCPATRDTTAYLSLEAPARLVCAGNEEWRLVAYLASAGGRGCFPVWIIDPGWMDPSCTFFYPQPTQSEFDGDGRLHAFVPPQLGQCDADGCPFDDLRGSWVEIVGHLDDPVAETCRYVRGKVDLPDDSEPPDPRLAAFQCRLNFVVDELEPTEAP